MGEDIAEELEKALAPHLGKQVRVTGLRPLSSGASRQSWRFEAGDPPESFVLQKEMVPGALRVRSGRGPVSMRTQAQLLIGAGELGVPVPKVLASGEMEGLQFIVTSWLEGEALPQKMLRDPSLASGRQRLMQDCARALAAIHRMPADEFDLEPEDRLAVYRGWMDTIGEPRPVLELAYRWLVTNRPDPGAPVVVHGDFRLGNLLVGEDGLRAVLDWEISHVGDRYEDVAWPTIRAWRFDRYRDAGDFPDPEGWLAAYNDAAAPDAKLDPDAFRWWQVASTWTWAVMSAMQARRHLDGWVRSMEHAAIGRRVCESEWDLLELLR